MAKSKSAYSIPGKQGKYDTHIIVVWVDNEAGVLARVVGLFSGRGYNIESLAVAENYAKNRWGNEVYLRPLQSGGINIRRNTFIKNTTDINIDNMTSTYSFGAEIMQNTFVLDTTYYTSSAGRTPGTSIIISEAFYAIFIF